MIRCISKFLIGLGLGVVTSAAFALAVSDVELNSHLNQSLDAKVYLLAAEKDELASLKIIIRDNSDAVNNRRPMVLEHKIIESAQGSYISISSKDVVREPILDFVLELNWSDGRLIREYTLIIDLQQ